MKMTVDLGTDEAGSLLWWKDPHQVTTVLTGRAGQLWHLPSIYTVLQRRGSFYGVIF